MTGSAPTVEATRRLREAQGLPPHVTDPAVLDWVADRVIDAAAQKNGPRSDNGGRPTSLAITEPPDKDSTHECTRRL